MEDKKMERIYIIQDLESGELIETKTPEIYDSEDYQVLKVVEEEVLVFEFT